MKIEATHAINGDFNDNEFISKPLLDNIHLELAKSGYCLIRGLDANIERFGQFIGQLCSNVTFDPARQSSAEKVQKVDSGADKIGLHIENGNTLKVPQIVSFYCAQAARRGSETTLCDGSELLQSMPVVYQELFSQPITVSRRVPEQLWKQYLVNEHPLLNSLEHATFEQLEAVLEQFPGASAQMLSRNAIQFSMCTQAIRRSSLSDANAFANAIMGPSFNYEKPSYQFADGSVLSPNLISELSALSENFTHEITWQDNDIVILDNFRVMHGRRKVQDLTHRKLYIGMGDI